MRQTVIVSALTAVVTVVLSVLALNQLGATSVSSSDEPNSLLGNLSPTSEADDQLQGDTDCDGDVDAVDGLGVLVNVAALDALNQQEPCTDVADVIPAGEGIPGPQGPPGPQGEQGPTETQGEPGISDWELVSDASPIISAFGNTHFVPCPAGKVPLGGGWIFLGSGGGDPGLEVTLSRPLQQFEEIDWQVGATAAGLEPWGIGVSVLCANVAE